MRPLLKIRNILLSVLLSYFVLNMRNIFEHALKHISTITDNNHKLLTISQPVYGFQNQRNKGDELIKLTNLVIQRRTCHRNDKDNSNS